MELQYLDTAFSNLGGLHITLDIQRRKRKQKYLKPIRSLMGCNPLPMPEDVFSLDIIISEDKL